MTTRALNELGGTYQPKVCYIYDSYEKDTINFVSQINLVFGRQAKFRVIQKYRSTRCLVIEVEHDDNTRFLATHL